MAIAKTSGAPDTGDRVALFHELRGLIVAVRELAEAMSLGYDTVWCWHLLNRAWNQLQRGVYLFIDEHRAELETTGVPLDGLDHLLEPINRALWREYHPEECASVTNISPLQIRLSVACDKLDMYLSEVDGPAEDADGKIPDVKSKGKGRAKRRRMSNPSPLTAKQVEAVQIVSECKGNLAEAAKRLGVHHSTLQEHHKAAMKKLGKSVVKHATRPMPEDRRGQANVADGDDCRV